MKRPGGFTFFSLLMGLLAIAGLANGGLMLSGSFGELPTILGLLAFAYGIAAAFGAVTLWRFQKPAIIAVRSWMAICLIFILAFVFSFGSMFSESLIGLSGFILFLVIVFFFIDRYVCNKFKIAT